MRAWSARSTRRREDTEGRRPWLRGMPGSGMAPAPGVVRRPAWAADGRGDGDLRRPTSSALRSRRCLKTARPCTAKPCCWTCRATGQGSSATPEPRMPARRGPGRRSKVDRRSLSPKYSVTFRGSSRRACSRTGWKPRTGFDDLNAAGGAARRVLTGPAFCRDSWSPHGCCCSATGEKSDCVIPTRSPAAAGRP